MADVKLDFKALAEAGSMMGSGAVVVCDEGTCMLDMALNSTRFFRNESCGKCVPCRVGSQKMVDLLTGWTQGHGSSADLALIDELSDALRLTSICGLGQVVPAPIASVLKHFRDEVEAHVIAPRMPVGRLFLRRAVGGSSRGFEARMSAAGLIELTIDGKKVSVPAGTSVFDAARLNDIAIPTLCHQQNETPVGVCRLCVVDVGARVFTASCVRPAEAGMVVNTASEKVQRARRTLVEMLMSDHPSPCARQQHSGDCELETLARQENVQQPRFARSTSGRAKDDSSMSIAVDFDACILCDRCIRGCSEIRENFVLGRMGKGSARGNRFRRQRTHGRIVLRLLRRVHGFLPHRSAHEQGRDPDRAGRGPCFRNRLAGRAAAPPGFQGRLRNISEFEPRRRGEAALQGRRNDLPRGRVRIDRRSTFSKAKRRFPSRRPWRT